MTKVRVRVRVRVRARARARARATARVRARARVRVRVEEHHRAVEVCHDDHAIHAAARVGGHTESVEAHSCWCWVGRGLRRRLGLRVGGARRTAARPPTCAASL